MNDSGATRGICPNCATEADGAFCAACGQQQGHELPTLWGWFRETLDELFFVNGRVPRTVRLLFWPPGALTEAWWNGRRARYVSPLRLYLLAAVPFFFIATGAVRRDDLQVGFFGTIVLGTFLTAEEVVGDQPNTGMQPLAADERDDPEARARWRAEFERRRIENRLELEAQERRASAGLQRVADLVPIGVGVFMIPLLALMLRAGQTRERKLVAHLVASLHTHTVTFTWTGVGWLFGHPALVGAAGTALYLTGARRRLSGVSMPRALLYGFGIPLVYAAAFLTLYTTLVFAIGTLFADLLFQA